MEYYPDAWVIVKIENKDTYYKLLAGWYGGYTTSDEWRLNSGITSYEISDTMVVFKGYSDSTYHVSQRSEGMTSLMSSIYNNIHKKSADADVKFTTIPFDQFVKEFNRDS
jgi:hypothetical protein